MATDPEAGRELLVEALAEHRRAGDPLGMCADLGNLAATMASMGQLVEARPWFEETIALAEEIGFRSVLPSHWAGLGMALLLDGEPEKAVPLCRKALLAARRADPRSVVSAIGNLALCAAALGDQRRAAQLTGAFEVLDAELVASAPALGWRSEPWELRMREDHRARLGEALGGTELERCLEAGRRMRIEEACDLALGKTGPK
jgi:tetratricopeptide (TPR) repeat protein